MKFAACLWLLYRHLKMRAYIDTIMYTRIAPRESIYVHAYLYMYSLVLQRHLCVYVYDAVARVEA